VNPVGQRSIGVRLPGSLIKSYVFRCSRQWTELRNTPLTRWRHSETEDGPGGGRAQMGPPNTSRMEGFAELTSDVHRPRSRYALEPAKAWTDSSVIASGVVPCRQENRNENRCCVTIGLPYSSGVCLPYFRRAWRRKRRELLRPVREAVPINVWPQCDASEMDRVTQRGREPVDASPGGADRAGNSVPFFGLWSTG
jgi:hypothetical protein